MMKPFNTIAWSVIVLFAIALIFISVNVERYVSEPSLENAENPIERLFEIRRADNSLEDDQEIFQRKTYAYLASDGQLENFEQSVRPVNDTANRLIVAKKLAKQKNYDKALSLLNNVKSSDTQSYDVRIMRAWISSSIGHYEDAEQIFRNLRAEFPHDPDLMVAYGHHFLNRGQLIEAENLFSQTLVEYPGYSDARAGLIQVRQARQ